MPATGWCPSDEWSIGPSRRQNATWASGSRPSSGNTSTPLSSSASRTARPSASSVASISESRPVTSAPTDAVSLLVVSTLISVVLSSRHRRADSVHDGVGGDGGFLGTENLVGHRHHDHRIYEVQEVQCILRHIVERELVAVVDRFLKARGERVVELAYLRHRSGQPGGPALWFGCQTPFLRELLVLGESARQAGFCHGHTPTGRRSFSYSSTQSTATLCRWRTRISWSLSGKSSTTSYSRAAWVPPNMPASCSANSLSTTEATSCSMRSCT